MSKPSACVEASCYRLHISGLRDPALAFYHPRWPGFVLWDTGMIMGP